MLAYMIYEEKEGEKNKGFIEMFQREGVRYGISFLFVSKEDYQKKELPDFVLNRTREKEVSLWYEEKKIPVFHSSVLVEMGNDKWKTFRFLKEHLVAEKSEKHVESFRSIAIPDTIYLPDFSVDLLYHYVTGQEWHRGEPLVLKTVDGHGGNEVFFLSEEERNKDLENTFERLSGKNCILQEWVPGEAMDVRVYIVGNRIYHGVLRKGERDFRSNYSLGGHVRTYDFCEKEREVIETCLEIFSDLTLGMVGLDFIVAEDGTLFFNELEEMVGCRMLYACSERDIVKDYLAWLNTSFFKR